MKKKNSIKQQKKALGIGDDEDESEEEEEGSEPEEEEPGVIRKVGGATAEAAAATTTTTQTIGGVPVKLPPGVQLPGLAKTVQEQAAQQVTQPTTPNLQFAQQEAARKAAILAQMISARKNLVSASKTGVQERYESELEINDYPQQARWKVTHKDALTQITEMTGSYFVFSPSPPFLLLKSATTITDN